jgi:hypothetical protein
VLADAGSRYPITGTAGCCARPASGHAAAPRAYGLKPHQCALIDEKSQIQALDRAHPSLQIKKQRAGTTNDYKRNGTLSTSWKAKSPAAACHASEFIVSLTSSMPACRAARASTSFAIPRFLFHFTSSCALGSTRSKVLCPARASAAQTWYLPICRRTETTIFR